jgi:hypothetical protein
LERQLNHGHELATRPRSRPGKGRRTQTVVATPVDSDWDLRIEIPGGRGQHSSMGAVAMGGALIGVLERAGTDEHDRFRVDELSIQRLGRDPDPVRDVGEFELSEKVERGRLVNGHRVFVSFL